MNAEPAYRNLTRLPTELVRFAMVGLTSTLVHVLIVFGLIGLAELSPGSSNAVAFVVATMISYCMNARWSFGADLSPRGALRFSAVALFCGGIAGGVATVAGWMDLPVIAGIAAVVVLVSPISFLLHKHFTFVVTTLPTTGLRSKILTTRSKKS